MEDMNLESINLEVAGSPGRTAFLSLRYARCRLVVRRNPERRKHSTAIALLFPPEHNGIAYGRF